jgi:hypothetical protein
MDNLAIETIETEVEPPPTSDTSPEGLLWRAVLERALYDLRHPLEQAKVEQWFMTDDYIEVCSLAGVDPQLFISHALKISSK